MHFTELAIYTKNPTAFYKVYIDFLHEYIVWNIFFNLSERKSTRQKVSDVS